MNASSLPARPHSKPPRALPLAIGMTLYQLALALFMVGGRPRRLVFWDATWYRDIAASGYYATFPITHLAGGGTTNLAFFPAFPLWARALLHALPLSPDAAVLLASWTSSAAMWAYFVLVARRLGARPAWVWVACLAWLAQPGAFYAIAGYSEPLFTAALLGHVYWSIRALGERAGAPRFWAFAGLAVAHGAVLTSCRLLGVPLAAFPVLLVLARGGLGLPRPRARALGAPLAIGLLSLSGFGAFLAYCALKWGRWDVYWEANRAGWNVYFDPWKLLSWAYYRDVFLTGNLSEVLGRLLTLATAGCTLALAGWAWRRRREQPAVLALTWLNLGLIAETVVGSHGMHSMIRYLVPIEALLIPCAAIWAQARTDEERARGWPPLGLRVGLGLTAIWLFAIQILFLMRYSRGEWVS